MNFKEIGFFLHGMSGLKADKDKFNGSWLIGGYIWNGWILGFKG